MSITGTITTTQIEVSGTPQSRKSVHGHLLRAELKSVAMIVSSRFTPGAEAPNFLGQLADGLKALPFKEHFQTTFTKST
jgi:hypothetical protein